MVFYPRDHSGKTFGMWTVLSLCAHRKSKKTVWLCQCNCGEIKEVLTCHLISGASVSCGCPASLRTKTLKTTHGRSKTSIHRIWCNIKSRCNSANNPAYYNYGGRGIKICDKWNDSFEAFFAYMGERPSLDHSIDRIDTNGDYEPSNCRWATRKVQANNTRRNHIVSIDGVTMNLTQSIEKFGGNYGTVKWRLKQGQTIKQALKL